MTLSSEHVFVRFDLGLDASGKHSDLALIAGEDAAASGSLQHASLLVLYLRLDTAWA
jgi:hypothetical protein